MRLFAAVDLDDGAREAVRDLQDKLRPRFGREIRWNGVEQLHLTLVFLGEVPDEKGSLATRAIGARFEQPAFDASFGGLGVFPPHGAPRVLWVGVERGGDELVALQQATAARLAGAGFAFEAREFRPHLTLARWRESRPSDRRRALDAAAPLAARTPTVVRVDHVTLYQSRLSSRGATYASLAKGELTA